MTTREEAIERAGVVFAEAFRSLHEGTVREAALRAQRAGGPPLEELERMIREYRERAA